MSIYLDLTQEFNTGRLRAIICSGPAVVLLRLAIASKDGDWILREEQAALDHVRLGQSWIEQRRGCRCGPRTNRW